MSAIKVPRILSDLSDVLTRTGNSLKFLRVNVGETALEYATSTGYDATAIVDPYIDIRAKGAVSGADSSTAINAAITQAADGVGRVLIPAGNFTVDATINHATGVKLVGVGPKTILTAKAGLNAPMIAGSGIDKALIAGFVLDGNQANQTTLDNTISGISLNNCTNVTIKDMMVTQCFAHCVYVYGVSNNIRVFDNYFYTSGSPSFILPGLTLGSGSGIRVHTTLGSGSRMKISRNLIIAMNGFGMVVRAAPYSTISDNTIQDSTNFDGILVNEGDHTIITGNNIKNVHDSGIVLEYLSDYSLIENNIIEQAGFMGTYLSAVNYCTVQGNVYQDNGQNGNNLYTDIILTNSAAATTSYATRNKVINNSIRANITNKTKYGVYEQFTACDYNIIGMNHVFGQATTPILLQGPNSINVNNILA